MAEEEAGSEASAGPEGTPATGPEDQVQRVKFDQLKHILDLEGEKNVTRFDDVTLQVSIELGRITLPIKEILEWREGNVVETSKLSGQPMEIMVNGRLFGKGEVVVVGDNLAIRITDLEKPDLD
jgi:flagellar motor switch protein FliN/FliY